MENFSLSPAVAPESRCYVLVVSGTFNPPHRGHVRLGLFAKERLEKLGHEVQAVCFVPVHDNYLLNKQTVAAKQSSSQGAEVFYPMAQRCEFLRSLLKEAAPEAEAKTCHVLDYEQQHAELLETSPNYWARKLPEGYLRTVPTASLLRHFAQHSPLLAPGKRRLGAVFGVDNLAGMSSWNSPAQLLEQTDLILVAREMQEVMISADPKDMFGALKHFCLEERVSVKYKDQELLPAELGNFENTKTSGNALLLLLPALKGDDEHLSSTQLRRSMTDLLGTMKLHGCCEELMVSMLHSTLESPKALAQNTALAIERGEAVAAEPAPAEPSKRQKLR